jgi:hypothetical protein
VHKVEKYHPTVRKQTEEPVKLRTDKSDCTAHAEIIRRHTEADADSCVCVFISSELIILLSTKQQREKSDQSIEANFNARIQKERAKRKGKICAKEKNLSYLGQKQCSCN